MKTLLLTAALIGIITLIVKQFLFEIRSQNIYREVDELHRQEWSGDPSDELMSWFRVRNRTLISKKIRTVQEYILFEEAFRTRIDQCRARNHSWSTITRTAGRPIITSTHN